MKLAFYLKTSFIALGLILCIKASAQNMESMYIEKLDAASIIFPAECTPEDLVIVINSSIQNLKFESNMLPSEEFKVLHNEAENQYILCHEKIKFKLTVSGPNLQSEDVDVFDLEKPLAYRITANTAKGTVNILTNPRNSTVIFPELNNLVLSTNQPITNISGKYKVNIVKANYKNVDTTIVIPRDAEKTYNIDLIPLFTRLKLDIKTNDNSVFQKAPVMWIDSAKLELDAIVKPGMNQRSFFDNVEFNKLYEGNIVPIPDGNHKIKVEAESYLPYETTVLAKNGKLYNLSVSLEPIFGYLTFADKQMAEGATVYIDEQKIGQVPLFKVKTKVGTHKVRFEKPGYVPLAETSSVVVEEKKVTDFDVSMFVARKISIQTNPQNAEVVMDNNRIGFTPLTTIVNEGTHEFSIKKSGFATEKFSKTVNSSTPDEEVQKIELRQTYSLLIDSEKKGLEIGVTDKNKNNVIDEKLVTPTSIQLPYGKYKLELKDGKRNYYTGTIIHKAQIERRGKLPNYSPSTFHLLEFSAGVDQKNGKIFSIKSLSDIDNFEASFGRIQVFPGSGLSSALINVDYKFFKTDSMNFRTIAPYFFFLNWDWRLGGSVLRQLDVNVLGRFKYTPGLKALKTHIPEFTDIEMLNYFYGLEVSSRLSYINLTFRFGRQINVGKLNYWDNENQSYLDKGIELPKRDAWIGTIGITLNGRNYNSNNMLRLWHNPVIDPMKKKTRKSDQSTPKKGLFGKAEKK